MILIPQEKCATFTTIFHALANEGNASKVFVVHAMINREDVNFMMLLVTLH